MIENKVTLGDITLGSLTEIFRHIDTPMKLYSSTPINSLALTETQVSNSIILRNLFGYMLREYCYDPKYDPEYVKRSIKYKFRISSVRHGFKIKHSDVINRVDDDHNIIPIDVTIEKLIECFNEMCEYAIREMFKIEPELTDTETGTPLPTLEKASLKILNSLIDAKYFEPIVNMTFENDGIAITLHSHDVECTFKAGSVQKWESSERRYFK